ncbi:MAG: DUF4405 domain-containing protein [Bdellovibrionales bacterium]|nr:DUF4405 domain-containing protein [Bdellovibrionales bacterium]
MRWIRAIATPLTIVSSIFVIASGLLMFFSIRNRFLGELHEQIGLVLVLAVVLHAVVNWNPFAYHFKSRATLIIFLLTLAFVSRAAFFREEEKGLSPGLVFQRLERADVSLLARLFEVPADEVVGAMKQDGLTVADASESLATIAAQNKKSPREILRYFVKGR